MSTTETTAGAPDFFKRVGELTRNLHDALQQLGYDKNIEASLGTLPDAKARLSFIARLTGDAAEKVLNTVDAAQAQQDALVAQAVAIEELLKKDPVGAVARGDVLNFIGNVKSNAQVTTGQLSEIMLAQDFHDLTGQTVQKVVAMATTLEDSLLKLLLETAPLEARATVETGFLNGPVIDPSGRTDVVSNQAQVDDLLESLGF
ncbi:protein phosphatase CheZ [uncultured Ramlibacter sp.]|uniref:protein phosphatase CheZ n=1 Tax=uncultured Ramlibacter sp. TaxID=260755 RepID=UPI002608FE29|nr:protein phosphatase CheZ [uncultured Ramlibacter sp.]